MCIQSIRKMSKLLCLLLSLAAGMALAQGPPAQTDKTKIQALQKQVDELSQELSRLQSAQDPAAQQQAMQRHWSMMQEHMRSMWQSPGMWGPGCNWMMMDPSVMGPMMGPGMMGPGSMGCGAGGRPMMGHGMGMGMMGQGGMMGWALPGNLAPKAYQQQMQAHMRTMHSQMAAIAAETDSAKRQALMREHYESMYRDMQTMRGMGWMWDQNATALLPDRDSGGAKLVAQFCTQCHAAPQPSLHTQSEWKQVTERMRQHLSDESNRSGSGIKVPSGAELDAIQTYLAQHARSS